MNCIQGKPKYQNKKGHRNMWTQKGTKPYQNCFNLKEISMRQKYSDEISLCVCHPNHPNLDVVEAWGSEGTKDRNPTCLALQ